MSRAARLLEVLIVLQTRPRFSVRELAGQFGVSRRTMLRDLHALSEMGVPLAATPGPGGGYALARRRGLAPLALSGDEAIGMVLSYEAFLRHAQSPFAAQSLSAIVKLRAALPPETVREIDRIRRHVAIRQPEPAYDAPLLPALLAAALDGAHLRVVYDSRSGVSERVIFPYGLYAAGGFWYCACHDYKRGIDLSLRADRFHSVGRAAGFARPPWAPASVAEWLATFESGAADLLRLRATVTPRGLKSYDLAALFGPIAADAEGGGTLDTHIPASELDFFAARLLAVGTDLRITSPPELIAAIRRKAQALLASLPPVPATAPGTRPDGQP